MTSPASPKETLRAEAERIHTHFKRYGGTGLDDLADAIHAALERAYAAGMAGENARIVYVARQIGSLASALSPTPTSEAKETTE